MRPRGRSIRNSLLAAVVFVALQEPLGAMPLTSRAVDDQRLAQLETETGDRPIDSLLEQALGYDERGDFKRAAELYRQLATQGVGVAELRLGWLFESGANGEQSYTLAWTHYETAALLGALEANMRLGLMSLEGWGTKRDPAAAVAYLRLASETGYQPAQKILSEMYFAGIGVARNLQEALGPLKTATVAPPMSWPASTCFILASA
jgi:TPR repeat protein